MTYFVSNETLNLNSINWHAAYTQTDSPRAALVWQAHIVAWRTKANTLYVLLEVIEYFT